MEWSQIKPAWSFLTGRIGEMARLVCNLCLALTTVLAIYGCDTQLKTDLFANDIYDAINGGGKPVTLHAIVMFEIPSSEYLEEHSQQISSFLQRHFKAVKDLSTKNVDFDSFCVAKTEIPLYPTKNPSSSHPFFYLSALPSDKGIEVSAHVDNNKFELFSRDCENEFMQRINSKDMSITIEFQNDTRKDITCQVYSVYANQKPVPLVGEISLKRREPVTLDISQVHIDYIIKNGKSVVIVLPKISGIKKS